MRRLLSLAAIAISAFVCAPVAAAEGPAAEPDAAAIERAKTLFSAADELEKGGDCKGALTKLAEVVAIKETAPVRLRMGRCSEKLGQLGVAQEHYERARDISPPKDPARAIAEERIAALSKLLAKVVIAVDSASGTATVTVDGNADARRTLWLAPGAHVVAATAPDKGPYERRLDLAAGTSSTVAISLGPPVIAAQTTVDESSNMSPGPFVLMGLAGLGAVIATPLGVIGRATLEEADAAGAAFGCSIGDDGRTCPRDAQNNPDFQDRYADKLDDASLDYGVAIGVGVASGALLVSGIIWLVADLQSEPTAEASPSPKVSIAPSFDPDGAGATVRASF